MQSAPVESFNVDNKKVLLARLNLMTYLMEASKYHDEFRDNNMVEAASAPIPKTVPENRSDDDKIASTSADQHASTSRDQRTSTSENNEEPMETDALMPSTLAVVPAQFPVSSSASTSAFVSTTDRSTMVTQSASHHPLSRRSSRRRRHDQQLRRHQQHTHRHLRRIQCRRQQSAIW